MHQHNDVRNQRRAGRGLLFMIVGFTGLSLLLFWWAWRRLPDPTRVSASTASSPATAQAERGTTSTQAQLVDVKANRRADKVEQSASVHLYDGPD